MTSEVEKRLFAADRALESGRYEQAEILLRQLLLERPGSIQATCLLSRVLTSTARIDQAIEMMVSLLSRRDDVAEGHLQLADMFREKKDPLRALRHSRRAVVLSRGDANALAILGSLQMELGQYHEAMQSLRAAIARDPRHDRAMLDFRACLLELEHNSNAETGRERSLALSASATASLYDDYGSALHRIDNHVEAVRAFQHALKLDSSRADCWGKCGDALRELGRFAEADDAYAMALKLKPNFVNALYGQMQIKAEAGKRLNQLVSIDPRLASGSQMPPRDVALLHYSAFIALEDLERFDEAFSHLLRANALMREGADYDERRSLGLIYEIIRRA